MTIKLLDRFERYACFALLWLFVSLLFAQVVLRVAFDSGVPQMEELSRFSFVWFVFLSASFAARHSAHNRVQLHLKLLPTGAATGMLLLADAIWILFNLTLAWASLTVINDLQEFEFNSPALNWSFAYIYWIFPLSFVAISVRVLHVDYLKYVRGEFPEHKAAGS